MNRIVVPGYRYGDSSYKVYNFSPGDYNIGDLVEIQEGGSSRLSVIVKRDIEFHAGNGCDECVFRNPEARQGIPCGYTTSDGWFPCVAICNRGASIMFKSIESIMEAL